MEGDSQKKIEELQQRNLDIQRQNSYQLWGNILVVNGLLISILTGVIIFSTTTTYYSWIVFVVIIFLVTSSTLLVSNMYRIKSTYEIIGNTLKLTNPLSEEDRGHQIDNALRGYKLNKITERSAYYIMLTGAVILILFLACQIINR